MRKNIQKNKLSQIPKSSSNKINLELSLKAKNRFSKLKYDSLNKETIDGSCVDTLIYNPESLNNSKNTLYKNNSSKQIENNKLIVFTSSLKCHNDSKNNLNNVSNKFYKHNFEFTGENSSNVENSNTLIQNDKNVLEEQLLDEDEDNTDRIDYRYYPKIPDIETNKENKFYWLAAYDKLMKKSKLIKILNYYTDEGDKKPKEKKLYDEQYNFKEKSMIVPGYEIYFLEKFNKPFIRPKKGGKIFIKLYLLNIEQINKIFSYINRLEYKSYINDMGIISEKNLYKNIINFNKSKYNYSTIFCLGSFMNTNIYLFSHIEKNKKSENNNINELPSPHKIAKLIKVLMLNFPDFTKEDFINYLTNFIQENNFTINALFEKKKEISALISSVNKRSLKLSYPNKIKTNSVIKNIIQKIPTAYSRSSYNSPNEFDNFCDSNINNISEINKVGTKNNIKGFNFFNKVDNIKGIKKHFSEKILAKINSNSFYLNKKLNTKKLKANKTNRTYDKSKKIISQKMNKKIDNLSYNINNTKLMNIHEIKFTTNINKCKKEYKKNESFLNKDINIDTLYNDEKFNIFKKIKKNSILQSRTSFNKKLEQNKENNLNICNTNLFKESKFNTYISYKNNNDNIIKTEINKQNTRNKLNDNFNPFYGTNTNYSNNNNIIDKKTNRVLASIRKIISQKLNNIPGNTNSMIKNMNFNNSNNSFKGNIITENKYNNKNLVCISKNNSKKKSTEYITPTKKRYYYYYH